MAENENTCCYISAFPVRSAKGAFAWVVCPLSLQRLARDRGRPAPELPELADMEAFAVPALVHDGKIVLEEYLHEVKGDLPPGILDFLADLVPDDPLWADLGKHLALVSDEMFQYYVEHTCEVVTRIRINDETGTVDNGVLFNQEQLPSECLLTGSLSLRHSADFGHLDILTGKLADNANLIQLGGDETIGLGQTSIHLHQIGGTQ